MMPTAFNTALVTTHSIPMAYALQLLLALPVLLHYAATQWRSAAMRERIEFTLLASFLLTPYLFVYDLMVLMPFLLNRLLAPAATTPRTSKLLAAALWFLPGFWLLTPLLPAVLHVPFLCLWVGCFYAYYFLVDATRSAVTS